MTLHRGARLEVIVLTAALLALSACGTASDVGPSGCAGCAGALCGDTCTDLSAAMKAQIDGALPSSACIPRQDLPNTIFTTACATSVCSGGAAGCNVQLAWTPVALSLATHKLTVAVRATSNMDVAQNGLTQCTAAVSADYAFEADVGFVCAAGSESLAVGTITPTLTASSNTGCETPLGAIVDPLPTFARDPAAAALARATTGVSASCSP